MVRLDPSNAIVLPTGTEVAEHIRNLEQLDLSSVEYGDVLRQTWHCFPDLPVSCGEFPSTMIMCRARLTETATPYTHQSEIGMPPSELLTNFGRANRPHQSIFYASASVDTAIREVCQVWRDDKKNVQGYATLGLW